MITPAEGIPGSSCAPQAASRRTPGILQVLLLCLAESRPVVQIMFLLRFVCGMVLIVADARPPGAAEWWRPLLGLLGWSLATAYVYLINGVEDFVADRVNGVGRPIERGDLDPGVARTVARCCAGGALLLELLAGRWMVVPTVAYLLLGRLYSVPPARFSARPVGSLAVVLGGISLTYAAGALCVGGHPTGDGLVFAALMTLWTTLVGATVKDLSDLEGDVASGRRPLVARLLPRHARQGISLVALSLGGLLCVAGAHLTALRLPGAVTLAGAMAMSVLLYRNAPATHSRALMRRPYRAFMGTQFVAHGVLIAEQLIRACPG